MNQPREAGTPGEADVSPARDEFAGEGSSDGEVD